MTMIATVAALLLATTAQAQTEPMMIPTATVEIRPDLRKCVAPVCGGWWYADVNAKATTCGDGTLQPECYAAWIDYTPLDLDDHQVDLVTDAAEEGLLWLKVTTQPVQTPRGTFDTLIVHAVVAADHLHRPAFEVEPGHGVGW